MIENTDIHALWSSYGAIFLLMFSTFLLGYLLATWFSKRDNLKKKLESKINTPKGINDIEVIFTEIKPKIIEIIKETQQQDKINPDTTSNKEITAKVNSSYVSYGKGTPKINFEVIGIGTPEIPDDLTKIEGIGPYVEQRLNNIGIFNYEQISKLEISDIRNITKLIDFFPERVEKDNWVGQAKSILLFRSKL